MTIATGVDKKVVIAQQSALGTIAAVDAATAAYIRRVTSNINLKKETYESNEIRTDQQVADFRHGARSVEGSISGELSPGSYEMPIESVLRKDWVAGVSDAANSKVAAANTATATGTFTRDDAAGSWLGDGFKVGDVVRCTGFDPGVANNSHNFMITSLTVTVMTVYGLDGVGPVAETKGSAITTAVTGKKTYVPTTGHTNTYFTIEANHSVIDVSKVFTDCKFNNMAVKLPASGMATIDFGVMGLDGADYAGASAPYFTDPTALGTEGILAAVNGVLVVNGAAVALLTSLDFTVDGSVSLADAAVGSNARSDVMDGRVKVSGNMSVYLTDVTYFNYFKDETEIAILSAFTDSNDADAEFLAFSLTRVKIGSSDDDDGEKGLTQSMSFTALLDTAGGTGEDTENTTISIQDSTLT